MALTPSSFFESDNIGNVEQITLAPLPPATSTDALIASAFYGLNSGNVPATIPIDADRKSFSFSILPGVFALTVTVVSPDPARQDVQLCQGTTQIDLITIQNHSGSGAVLIRGISSTGTASAAAATRHKAVRRKKR
jgi:hypothetical protein